MDIDCILNCDILIVGGGAAGIKAAIEAGKSGKSIILVNEKKVGRSGSTFYINSPEWGLMFANVKDDVDVFFKEILSAADGCVDEKLVYLLAENSRECFDELVKYGLDFELNSDIDTVPCFGNKPRGAMLLSLKHAIDCFNNEIKKYRNIQVLENVVICDLIVKNGTLQGAVGFDKDGSVVALNSAAVILACGGAESIYEYSYSTGELYGSAYAMAARQGVRLVNLEFIQFICATVAPVKGLNYSHFILATNPLVVNQKGEEFLDNYLPDDYSVAECLKQRSMHGPFSTSTIIIRAGIIKRLPFTTTLFTKNH